MLNSKLGFLHTLHVNWSFGILGIVSISFILPNTLDNMWKWSITNHFLSIFRCFSTRLAKSGCKLFLNFSVPTNVTVTETFERHWLGGHVADTSADIKWMFVLGLLSGNFLINCEAKVWNVERNVLWRL